MALFLRQFCVPPGPAFDPPSDGSFLDRCCCWIGIDIGLPFPVFAERLRVPFLGLPPKRPPGLFGGIWPVLITWGVGTVKH